MDVKGGCLCGAVQVRARIAKRAFGACHCSLCRTWGGGPMLAVECEDAVEFAGQEHIATYASSTWAERGFCRVCGTHLFYRLRAGGLHALPLGLLEDSRGWHFSAQVFIDDKPEYYSFANPTSNLTGADVFALHGADDEQPE